MGKLKGKTISQREFNRINKAIWETIKHILRSLEDDNDDSNLEFFYTLPKNLSQPIYATTKSRMKEDHGRWHSKKLLDFHEIIVGQVSNTRCACSCYLKPTRKSFNKVLYSNPLSNVNDNEGSSQRVGTT
jgi:hypothetical protein